MRNPKLTDMEARAVLAALSETLDATDDEEQRTIFGGRREADAARRADRKIHAALRAAQ